MDGSYKLTEESFVKNTVGKSLEEYPRKSHGYFSFYFRYDKNYFLDDRPYLFFNNVNNWEDPEDRNKFTEPGKKYFVRCLIYQPSESVAMWRIYGYPANLMLKFKAPYLRQSLGLNKTNGKQNKTLTCLFKIGSIECEMSVPQNYLKIYDVLYFAKSQADGSSDVYYVEKGSFNSKRIKGSHLRNIDGKYLKRAAFAYERETRFYFALDEAAMNEIFEKSENKNIERFTYEQVESIKVYLDKDCAGENISVYKLPSFLSPKEVDKEKFNYVQNLEKIDSWNLKVQKSSLDDGSDL